MYDELDNEILSHLPDGTALDKDALAIKYETTVLHVSNREDELRKESSNNYDKKSSLPTKISKLIGEHPKSELFFDWCESEDASDEHSQKYRKLSDKGINRGSLIEKLADLIILHHSSEKNLKRLEDKKGTLEKHAFKQCARDMGLFPMDNIATQKGNLVEIILAEYLTASSGLELLVYKLRFNPNVEQSMKGDDVLLFDKKNITNKLIMGESKYRTTPNQSAVTDIMEALSKDKLPISLSFIRDRLDDAKEEQAEQISELITNIKTKKDIPIIYVGFLHSNHNVEQCVKKYFHSDNENLVLISYGEKNPSNLIEESFKKAMEKIESQYDS